MKRSVAISKGQRFEGLFSLENRAGKIQMLYNICLVCLLNHKKLGLLNINSMKNIRHNQASSAT